MTAAPLLHQAVEAHADRAPHAPAVYSPDGTLSYAELESAANRVAARLRAEGVTTGTLVALFGRPTPGLLAGLLGTLKAGAAWVPLEPGDPPERTRTLIEQVRPAAVLCTPEWSDEWIRRAGSFGPALPAASAFTLDDGLLASGPARRVPVPVRPEDLAYVLFTSGSTGAPKGVAVEHRSILNYCRWVAGANRVGGAVAPLPAVTRMVADASMQQLIAPLTRGDAVWLVPESTRTDPELLLAELSARPGSGLHCVPSLWEELLLALEHPRPGAARPEPACLFLGGESVRPDLWERTRRLLPTTALANVYGPTEATVQATGGFQPVGAPLTVGRPVDNTRVLILDPDGRAVPDGEQGEVYLGGACLARGYYGRPDLTAQRFLDTDAGRLYRTGDLGALLPDGSLTLAGRLDDQVKIRGYRVEPGEVEAVVAALPGVRRAAVAVRTDRHGAASLVAAVESADGSDGAAEALIQELASRLPAHLVPTTLRVYDHLPTTPSGKIDRVRIRDEARPAAGAASPAAAPAWRTPTEELVASIWTELLDRPPSTPDDDFFQLGGHSLVAVRVVGRLRRALGVQAQVATLFEQRTVSRVAQALDALVPLRNGDDAPNWDPEAPAPLSVQQEALWATEQLLAGTPFNTMLLPVLITGSLEVPVLAGALGDVVGAHPALRSRIVAATDGRPTQTIARTGTVPMPLADLSAETGQALEKAAGREVRRLLAEPPDPVNGPVLRARLLRLDHRRHVLLLALHHLFCDGVSLEIVLSDLASAYRERMEGSVGLEPPARPPHLGYAHRQRDGLDSERYAADLAYWTEKLAVPAPPLRLAPGSDSGTDAVNGRFQFVTAAQPLGADLAENMRDFARRHGATPFTCVTAAIAALLHSRDGVSPVRFGTLSANREDPELERAVGLFAVTVVLDIPVDPKVGFADLVAAARTETLAGLARQRVPLEAALDALGSTRPPFQVGVAWEPARTVHTADEATFEVYQARDGAATMLPSGAVLPSSTAASFVVREQGADLVLTLEASRALLDQDEARDLLSEARRMLGALLAAPGEPIGELTAARR